MIPVCVHAHLLSHLWLFGTPWSAAHQAPLSMEFPRQEYWSRLPFCARNLPNPRIEPVISCISCIGRLILYYWATWEAPNDHYYYYLKRYFTSSYIWALAPVWSLFFLSSGHPFLEPFCGSFCYHFSWTYMQKCISPEDTQSICISFSIT